jgi:eukaryotic-like serine/threonine-protein kinase
MVPDPRRVKALFNAARRLPAPDRSAWLDGACADPAVRARVNELLAAYDGAGGFLSRHPDENPTPPPDGPTECGEPGTRFGPYILRRLLGEGGMGTVWAADQDEPLRRTVALKVVKPGMDSAQVLGRFDGERRALALMDHPHIARVLDAGRTPAGRPFFVMELVTGDAITRYAARARLPLRARLELFAQVCRAVQHAHQKGVIHRDLKPSNVLVTEVDGRAVPKVIDFGIAKAVEFGRGNPGSTAADGGVLGTPEYMAPEQAEPGAADIDTRVDVYALGALLYELLVGTPPLGPRPREPLAVTLRRVREDVPPRPSARLLALTPADRTAVAAERGTDPGRLHADLRRELDWLVARALEKEPDRRYPSVADLSADVDRWLTHEPLSARPPGRWYRGRKFVRKHRGAVAAAGAVGLALVAGAGAATVGLLRARAAEQEALAGLAREADLRRLADGGVGTGPGVGCRGAGPVGVHPALARVRPAGRGRGGLGRDVTPRQVVEAVERQLAADRTIRPRVEARVSHALGQNYLALAEPAKAEGHLRIAARLDAAHPPEDPADAFRARIDLAGAVLQAGRVGEAIALYELVIPESEARLGPEHLVPVAAKSELAMAYDLAGRSAEAVQLLEAVVPVCVRRDPKHPDTLFARTNLALAYSRAGRTADALKAADGLTGPDHDLDAPEALNSLCVVATVHLRAGDPARAAGMLERALPHVRKKLGPDHTDTLAVEAALAGTDVARGRPAAGVQRLEGVFPHQAKALGPDHPDVLRSSIDLALGYGRTGRAARGAELLEAAVPKCRARFGPDHPDALTAAVALAELYEVLGRPRDALGLLEATVPRFAAAVGPRRPDALVARLQLASAYDAAGRSADALKLLHTIAADCAAALPPDHPQTQRTTVRTARLHLRADRPKQAKELIEPVLAKRTATLGADHPDTLSAAALRAAAEFRAGRPAGAEEQLRKLLPACRTVLGETHPETLNATSTLVAALMELNRFPEAFDLAEQLRPRYEAALGPRHPDTLTAGINLAWACFHAGQRDRAVKEFETVVPACRAALGDRHSLVVTGEAMYALVLDRLGRPADAVPLLERVVAVRRGDLGPDHPLTVLAAGNLAVAMHKAGRAGARDRLQQALPACVARLGPGHGGTVLVRRALAVELVRAGRPDEAVPHREELVAVMRAQFGPKHGQTSRAMFELAEAYAAAGQTARAKAMVFESLKVARDLSRPGSQTLAADVVLAGRLFLSISDYEAAEPLMREALALSEGAPKGHWAKAAAEALVGRALLGQGRLTAAEPLLLSGRRGLAGREVPADAWARPADADEWLVQLYDAWGKPAEAGAWRDKLGLPPREILPPPRVVGR